MKKLILIWLPLVLLSVALYGCGQPDPEPSPEPTPPEPPIITSVTVVGEDGKVIAKRGLSVDTPQPVDTGSDPVPPPSSRETLILESDVIVRASLLSVSTSTVSMAWGNATRWRGLLVFRFQVHEYLKGSGGNEVTAVVADNPNGPPYDTEAEAQAAVPTLLAAHDTYWHDRQAVLFLKERSFEVGPDSRPLMALPAGHLWLGTLRSPNRGGYWEAADFDTYSVKSTIHKAWWPGAASSVSGDGARAAPTDPLFLVEDPRAPQAGSSGAGGSDPRSASDSSGQTVGLNTLKSRIAALEAEANAGGTDDYRTCVEHFYKLKQHTSLLQSWGTFPVVDETTIASGLPAGTQVYIDDERSNVARSSTDYGRVWLDGPDKDYMRIEPHTFHDRSEYATEPDPRGYYYFYRRILTERPLPARTYRVYPNRLGPGAVDCNMYPDDRRSIHQVHVTVTAPDRTVHEAFFDPVDIGSAVGADSSNGVLKPNAFSLNNTTTTISSLKWEDGAVTMTLNPTASLANYAIDFIDVTGTTTLSLSSDNASTTPLTWTVPDKPWADGDLLMLRIHRPVSADATLSGLALSGVDITFSTATTTYTASVPATTTQTTVTPTTSHDSATYVVKLGGVVDDDGTIPLAAGDNVITIDVTAEDAVTTQTYTVTVTRATPSEPVSLTLIPRVNGLTFFDIDIQWNYSGSCENYYVAIITDADYQISFLGFHPPETSSHYVQGGWLYDSVPDFWVVVECRTSGDSQEVGRASLRAAHPDNN